MPTFTSMDLLPDGNILRREDLYSDRNGGANGALYDPSQPRTMEQMRGNLDKPTNYTGGDDSIEPWMVQTGSLVRGSYWGTDRWCFQYAKQTSKALEASGDASLRIVHSQLTKKVFLPWDAGTVLYGYQAWFRQDATRWEEDDDTPTYAPEFWDVRVRIGGSVKQASYARLPYGRQTDAIPSATLNAANDPGMHQEDRWRWVSKDGGLKDVSKGYFTVQITIGCLIHQPDQKTAKLLTPSCGAWVMAFR